jgi:hypothetical protein
MARASPPNPEVLQQHHVLVPTDSSFQRRARLIQALWREEMGYPIGLHRGTPLGSRLAMPFAEQSLANYLTPTIRRVVRREVLEAPPGQGRLFGRPRIFNDLLSSQPLCFNLFAELAEDRELAASVLNGLLPEIGVSRVLQIEFEYSPGRGDPLLTDDRSAFDVFIRYENFRGAPEFLGIEVKYHENLVGSAAAHRNRYDELAASMDCFVPEARDALMRQPLQQIWRDHLLVAAVRSARPEYGRGRFVLLSPARNERCRRAVAGYRACLRDDQSFLAWSLEEVLDALAFQSTAPWIGHLRRRYLGSGTTTM